MIKYCQLESQVNMNDMSKVYYNLEIYNNYVNFPIVQADIENFELDELLFHPNLKIREFNLIIIKKVIEKENITIVTPLIAIYNKNDWKVKSNFEKRYFNGYHMKTYCSNEKQTLTMTGKLIKIPCNTQNNIITTFNAICNVLIYKNKIENNLLVRKK